MLIIINNKEYNKNNLKMNKDVRNRCGKRRGCYVTILTKDSDIKPIDGRTNKVHRALLVRTNDILAMDSLFKLSMDKMVEKKRQMEKSVS